MPAIRQSIYAQFDTLAPGEASEMALENEISLPDIGGSVELPEL